MRHMELRGFPLVVLQAIAYGKSIRKKEINAPNTGHTQTRKALAVLGSHGYVTLDTVFTAPLPDALAYEADGTRYYAKQTSPVYRLTDEGRKALDALRRSHPEASPYVKYR